MGSGFRVPGSRFWVQRFTVQTSHWPEKRLDKSKMKLHRFIVLF